MKTATQADPGVGQPAAPGMAPAGAPATVRLDGLDRALAELAAGRLVAVVDDAGRENEADLIGIAELASPEALAFMIRNTSGVICAPMTSARLDALAIDDMVARNQDPKRTAYTVSVDAAAGITTGISAADRARTLAVLADASAAPGDLTRPGHVLPLRAAEHGVLARAGHTEAAVDLARLAGFAPAGYIAELAADDGTIMAADAARAFADEHGLALISIEQIRARRVRDDFPLDLTEPVALPMTTGRRGFAIRAAVDRTTGVEHALLTLGDYTAPGALLRMHSECLTGDVFGSARCDCGAQLDDALAEIDAAGAGAVLYVRGHEGRGIGLAEKLRAYALQDDGLDTAEANLALGHEIDARDWAAAAAILHRVGLNDVRLISNNPDKVDALAEFGVRATLAPRPRRETPENARYLATKSAKMRHAFADPVARPAG